MIMNGIISFRFRPLVLTGALVLFLCSCSSTKNLGTDADSQQEQTVKKGKAFSFVQLSDPQLGFLNGNDNFSEDSLLLARAIYKVNDLRPAFVLMTGDMTNASGNTAQIRCYKEVTSRLNRRIPLYHVPGNHDGGSGTTDAKVSKYIANYGPDHFSFDYADCFLYRA